MRSMLSANLTKLRVLNFARYQLFIFTRVIIGASAVLTAQTD